MELAIAHCIASQKHEGQRTRFDDPVIDHLAHATITSDAPPYAWARKCLLASANGVTCRRSVG
jgi:hypothetical protein